MTQHSDWEDSDLDDTVRNLRVLADAPGDLRFRQGIAASFGKVNDKLQKIELRLARIDERQLSRTTVAEMVKTEQKVLESKIETLNKIVWGLCGASGVTLIGIILAKVFK